MLRWYGHVRKDDDDWVKKCMEYEVEGPRPRGRPKRTWREVVREDCQACKLNKEDAMDRCKWRKMIKDVRWSGWVWAGECFFWYWPTRVVPDKRPLNGCVCVCVIDNVLTQQINSTLSDLVLVSCMATALVRGFQWQEAHQSARRQSLAESIVHSAQPMHGSQLFTNNFSNVPAPTHYHCAISLSVLACLEMSPLQWHQ